MSRRHLILCTLLGAFMLIAFFGLSSDSANDVPKDQALEIYLDHDLKHPYDGQFPTNMPVATNTISFTIWLFNRASYPLEHLSLVPSPLPANWTFTWTLEGHSLQPKETKQATVTLTAPESSNVGNMGRLEGRFLIVYYVKEG